MRRLLVLCAVMAMIVAAFLAARPRRAALAASASNLEVTGTPALQGCPLGPAIVFCDQIPAFPSLSTTGFQFKAINAVTNVAVALAATPGLSANFAAADFTISNNTCSGSLSANQTCEFQIRFTPTANSLRAATLSVTDGNGDTLKYNLEGTGANLAMGPPLIPPACPLNTDNAFVFCNEPVGGVSTAETFTLRAGATVTSLNVAVTAVPGLSSEFAVGDFTIAGTTCTGTLGAGGNCAVNVEFTPTMTGFRAAELIATDAAGDTTLNYIAGQTNTGIVISAGSIPCSSLVEGVVFCNEPEGGQTAAATLSVLNTSGTQLTGVSVPSASANGNFTVSGTSCVATLAANASCTMSVEFTPKTTGEIQDSLKVTDSEGDVTGFNLAGYGDDFNLQLASGQNLEVNILQGGTATFNLQVAPDSVFGQNGEQVTFVCPGNLPDNTSCTIAPCPASITPGAPAGFTATFVTSSVSVLAPRPAPDTPCASYGPAVLAGVPGGGMRGPRGPSARPTPQFPALAVTLILGAIALLAWGFAAMAGGRRRRAPWVFACAGIAMMVFAGCHHSTVVTQATPLGETTMTVQAIAVDANGNPLNASRTLPQNQAFTLDVVGQIKGFP